MTREPVTFYCKGPKRKRHKDFRLTAFYYDEHRGWIPAIEWSTKGQPEMHRWVEVGTNGTGLGTHWKFSCPLCASTPQLHIRQLHEILEAASARRTRALSVTDLK